jgi:hypothetical protein
LSKVFVISKDYGFMKLKSRLNEICEHNIRITHPYSSVHRMVFRPVLVYIINNVTNSIPGSVFTGDLIKIRPNTGYWDQINL